MIPGFVQLGILAVLFQLLIIAGLYAYLRWRRSATHDETRTRPAWVIGSGAVLAGLGQLVGLGAIGSLRTSPALSLQEAVLIQNAALAVTLLGYVVAVVGFVLYSRRGS